MTPLRGTPDNDRGPLLQFVAGVVLLVVIGGLALAEEAVRDWLQRQ